MSEELNYFIFIFLIFISFVIIVYLMITNYKIKSEEISDN